MHARRLQQPQCAAVGVPHPGNHAAGIAGEFQFDRGGADKAGVADGGQVFVERRVAAAGRQIAVMHAVASGQTPREFIWKTPSLLCFQKPPGENFESEKKIRISKSLK